MSHFSRQLEPETGMDGTEWLNFQLVIACKPDADLKDQITDNIVCILIEQSQLLLIFF